MLFTGLWSQARESNQEGKVLVTLGLGGGTRDGQAQSSGFSPCIRIPSQGPETSRRFPGRTSLQNVHILGLMLLSGTYKGTASIREERNIGYILP